MAARIPQEFINTVLDRVDIAEVVGARIDLKRAGAEFKARCPFHDERTPSFHVVPNKGFYHCFGCGTHGTALTFLLEHDRLSFVDAVEALASRAGLQVPRERSESPRDQRRTRLLTLLARADRYFQTQLRQHPQRRRAVDYLKNRGIDGTTARHFGLGFAPSGWAHLKTALGGDGELDYLIESGLVVQPEDAGGRSWDRFRDRIMFPIRDLRGRTIAFGGRVIDEGKPKYLNSPETPVFHKGRELYGLWECRQTVREPGRLVLVEGYMDVLALAQAGVPESVASLGTAASAEHLQKVFRLAPEVVFCFDGDDAGRRAAWQAVQTVLEVLEDGVAVRLLLLPDGDDPDSLVRREGGEAFRTRMAGATALSEFLFHELARELDTATMDGRARLAHQALPLLARVPGRMFREMLLRRLAELTALAVETLEQGLADARSRGAGKGRHEASVDARPERPTEQSESTPAPPRAASASARPGTDAGARRSSRMRLTKEDAALALVLRHPELATRAGADTLAALDAIDRDHVRLLAAVLRRLLDEPGLSPMALVAEHLGTEAHGVLSDLAGREMLLGREGRGAEFDDALARLVAEREHLGRRALYDRLQTGEVDDEALQQWVALKQETNGVRGAREQD